LNFELADKLNNRKKKKLKSSEVKIVSSVLLKLGSAHKVSYIFKHYKLFKSVW